MSLDLWLEIDTGGPNPAVVWDDWNYTHNVNPMYYIMLGESLGSFLIGKTVEETLPKLRGMVEHMKANPEMYRALNPSNGWGDYDSLVDALDELIHVAARHSKCTWGGSR